ncbi:MAG: hypothetical protein IPL48_06735 [Bacteroidetes bacterium]|nr:hypothetical protein [Bacteroidota bacterium]
MILPEKILPQSAQSFSQNTQNLLILFLVSFVFYFIFYRKERKVFNWVLFLAVFAVIFIFYRKARKVF